MTSFRGLNGTVVIENKNIVIKRDHALDKTFHKIAQTIIPIQNLQNVIFVPGSLVNGHISFVEIGKKGPQGIWRSIHDNNTVVFRMFQNTAAEQFAKAVMHLKEGT